MLWFSVWAVLLTGLVVAAVTIIPLGSMLRSSATHNLEHLRAVESLSLAQYANALSAVAVQITSRTRIRQELEAYNRGERTLGDLRAFSANKLHDAMIQAPSVRGISRRGPDGTVLIQVGEAVPAIVEEILPAGVEEPRLVGPVAVADGRHRIAVAAPIRSRTGSRAGTDVVVFDAVGLAAILAAEDNLDIPARLWLGVPGRDGALTYFTSRDREKLVPAQPPNPSAALVLGAATLFDAPGPDGQQWSMSVQRVAATDWMLVVGTPSEALYGDVDTVLALAALAVIVLVGAGVAALLAILRPLAGHVLISTSELETQVRELQGLRTALETKQRQLEESNAELEQFAYAASHDLQQPLRVVSGFLDLLRRRNIDKLDGEALSFIQEAIDGATRMRTMIDGLLEYSRVGRLEKAIRPVDLNGVVDRAEANLAPALEESAAEIEQGPLPTVQAEPNQMLRLFQNLIENAVKYRHPERPPHIRITAEAVGTPEAPEQWRIAVADNGQGMDPAQAPRAFGLFQRLQAGGTGTGMGLALCQKIVTRHGGTIELDTEPERGTTVVFTLPAVSRDDAADTTEKPEASDTLPA